MRYLADPTSFDPGRGVPLEGFLAVAARRNLQDLLESEKRRKARESEFARLWADQQDQPAFHEVAEDEDRSPSSSHPTVRARMSSVLEVFTDPIERAVLNLYLKGERRTLVYAQMMGLNEKAGDTRRCVRRVKDRVLKRLRRSGLRLLAPTVLESGERAEKEKACRTLSSAPNRGWSTA